MFFFKIFINWKIKPAKSTSISIFFLGTTIHYRYILTRNTFQTLVCSWCWCNWPKDSDWKCSLFHCTDIYQPPYQGLHCQYRLRVCGWSFRRNQYQSIPERDRYVLFHTDLTWHNLYFSYITFVQTNNC